MVLMSHHHMMKISVFFKNSYFWNQLEFITVRLEQVVTVTVFVYKDHLDTGTMLHRFGWLLGVVLRPRILLYNAE